MKKHAPFTGTGRESTLRVQSRECGMSGRGRSLWVAPVNMGEFKTPAQIVPDSYVDWLISRFIEENIFGMSMSDNSVQAYSC